MKKSLIIFFVLIGLSSCKVVFITGYDPIIDQTATKMKRDFNLFFIKFSRTIRDTDPSNQSFNNFQDFYDNMEVDLKIIEDRTISLPQKADMVKKQITNLKQLVIDFENTHKKGIADLDASHSDDKHVDRNNINTAIDALLKLQESLKTNGK